LLDRTVNVAEHERAKMAAELHDGPIQHVLLVDDDPTVRTVLNALLAECGFEVVGEAANGAEAVELAEDLRPDIVLMDIQMPTMNGYEAAR
jgi:YesN/AraC family two-component response regulator